MKVATRRSTRGEGEGNSLAFWAVCCVVGVVLLGAALLFAKLIPQQRAASHRIMCINNQKQIIMGCMSYASDNASTLPTNAVFLGSSASAYGWAGLQNCPATGGGTTSDYVYLGDGLALADIVNPSDTIILHDRVSNHQPWINCAYADGSVRSHDTKAKTWAEFRTEREADGNFILKEPSATTQTDDGELPSYQNLD